MVRARSLTVLAGLLVGLVSGPAATAGPGRGSEAIVRHASSFAPGVNWADQAGAKDKSWDVAAGPGLFRDAVRPLSRPAMAVKTDPAPSEAPRPRRLVTDAPHLRGPIRNFGDPKPVSGHPGAAVGARGSAFGALENLPGGSK
jgi:hypothetical protein